MQTLSAYLNDVLAGDAPVTIDADYCYELAHRDHAEGSVDLMVVVAHAFSEMSLTPAQASRAAMLMARLAIGTLLFNAGEGSVWSEAAVNAAMVVDAQFVEA